MHVRMWRNSHEVGRGPWTKLSERRGRGNDGRTFVPPSDTFGLEGLPQAINRILVKSATGSPVWADDGRLVIDASKSLSTE